MTAPNPNLLLEPGMSLIVGTVDAAGNPDSSRAWGVRRDGDHLRVLFDAAAVTALANLRATGRLALTSTEISTLRSVQVKAELVAVDEVDDEDRAFFDAYWPSLLRAIQEEQGTELEVMQRLVPSNVVAVTCRVDATFDQTPGPGAGQRLAMT